MASNKIQKLSTQEGITKILENFLSSIIYYILTSIFIYELFSYFSINITYKVVTCSVILYTYIIRHDNYLLDILVGEIKPKSFYDFILDIIGSIIILFSHFLRIIVTFTLIELIY